MCALLWCGACVDSGSRAGEKRQSVIGFILGATLSLMASGATALGQSGESDARLLQDRLGVEVWASSDIVQRWERVQVWVQPETDAFVMLFRVDTDGRVRVLFPTRPGDDGLVRAATPLEIPGFDSAGEPGTFVVDDYPGTGYLFAVASSRPFDYGAFAAADHWDYRIVAHGGRITRDPHVALLDLVEPMLPADGRRFGYDVYAYQVGETHDYPRFLCYECHAYAPYPSWNPYSRSCPNFQVVVLEAPYDYATQTRPGTRLVYDRTQQSTPMYVFTKRAPTDPAVTIVGASPSEGINRSTITAASAAEVGGVGHVATPEDPANPIRRQGTGVAPRGLAPATDRTSIVQRLRPRLERRTPHGSRPKRVQKPSSTLRRRSPGQAPPNSRPVVRRRRPVKPKVRPPR